MGLRIFRFRDPLASPAGGGQTSFPGRENKAQWQYGTYWIDMTSGKDLKAL